MIRFLFTGNVMVYLALLIVALWFFGIPGVVGIVILLLLLA